MRNDRTPGALTFHSHVERLEGIEYDVQEGDGCFTYGRPSEPATTTTNLMQSNHGMSFSDIDRQDREWAERALKAQAAASQAYERLLYLAEKSDSGQARRIAYFVASTFDGQAFPLDLFELRAVDVAIGDDMLTCLDALRWGKADLYKLVPDGHARILRMCEAWGIKWPA
jgi:hypothetical protein